MEEKYLELQMLDQQWKEHLLNLDHLRQGINLRAFGQKDPLNEYKTEAFAAFENMLDTMREMVTQTLSLVEVSYDSSEEAQEDIEQMKARAGNVDPDQLQEGRSDPAQAEAAKAAPQDTSKPVTLPFDRNDPSTWGKVQRNAACPCGSGKKYKHCHGKLV